MTDEATGPEEPTPERIADTSRAHDTDRADVSVQRLVQALAWAIKRARRCSRENLSDEAILRMALARFGPGGSRDAVEALIAAEEEFYGDDPDA
jgi:hypothetical protein